MPQLQHNMWVINAREAALSIITGGGKWVEITIPADALYQHLLLTAEKKFWRCVESGEPPRLFGVDPPRARIEAVRIIDMFRPMPGRSSPASLGARMRLTSSMRMPRRSSKASCRRMPRKQSDMGLGRNGQDPAP